jgi:hypothetical protein
VVFCVRELHTVLLRRKGGVFLVGVNEITLSLYRETVWYLESKERLGKTCVLRHGYIIRGPALSTESESRCHIDTLNTNINIHCSLRDDSVRTLQRTPALVPTQLPVQ